MACTEKGGHNAADKLVCPQEEGTGLARKEEAFEPTLSKREDQESGEEESSEIQGRGRRITRRKRTDWRQKGLTGGRTRNHTETTGDSDNRRRRGENGGRHDRATRKTGRERARD